MYVCVYASVSACLFVCLSVRLSTCMYVCMYVLVNQKCWVWGTQASHFQLGPFVSMFVLAECTHRYKYRHLHCDRVPDLKQAP